MCVRAHTCVYVHTTWVYPVQGPHNGAIENLLSHLPLWQDEHSYELVPLPFQHPRPHAQSLAPLPVCSGFMQAGACLTLIWMHIYACLQSGAYIRVCTLWHIPRNLSVFVSLASLRLKMGARPGMTPRLQSLLQQGNILSVHRG